MAHPPSDHPMRTRAYLIGFGALSAICLWALVDSWGANRLGPRAFLALMSWAAVFFGVALAMLGPLPARRALVGALVLAFPVSALISWAGLRFDEASPFLNNSPGLAVAALIVLLATPFVLVFLAGQSRWTDYAALFDAAWSIAVRYVAGWLFVGVFWVVVFLSNALLELVGIDIIDILFDVDWVRFAISGAILGLGLAVAFELRAYVSPRLPLRLLRLLLPILLVVVALFLAALPFRGLSDLFGDFSSAAPLMGVAIAAISLISIALDRDEGEGIATPGMRMAARALAVCVPVLAALALWAVLLRVQQYAWTPDRVLAAAIAAVLLVYGLFYASAALLRGAAWRGAIRQGNVWMAMVALATAIAWLTPILNAQRISSDSQVTRYLTNAATADQLPLWQMNADWGRAGAAALSDLATQAAARDDTRLRERLDALEKFESRYAFERDVGQTAARIAIADLLSNLPVRPQDGLELQADMFADLPEYRVSIWRDGCAQGQSGAPSCVWISGPFLPGIAAQDQAILLYDAGGRIAANHLVLVDGRITRRIREVFDSGSGDWAQLPANAVSQVLSGTFELVPSGISALRLNGLDLVPGN